MQPVGAYAATSDYYDSHFFALTTNYNIGGTNPNSIESLLQSWAYLRLPDQGADSITVPVGCCKVEKWGSRSYTRYRAKVECYRERVCDATSKMFILNTEGTTVN